MSAENFQTCCLQFLVLTSDEPDMLVVLFQTKMYIVNAFCNVMNPSAQNMVYCSQVLPHDTIGKKSVCCITKKQLEAFKVLKITHMKTCSR